MGGIVEFVELVPAIFAVVAAMLVCLTRMEDNLSAAPRPARVRPALRRAVGAVRTLARGEHPALGHPARPGAPVEGSAGIDA